jgi:hypothetical protein
MMTLDALARMADRAPTEVGVPPVNREVRAASPRRGRIRMLFDSTLLYLRRLIAINARGHG